MNILIVLREQMITATENKSLKVPSENNLITILDGCKKGVRKYQQALYERYYGTALSICLRYVRNREDAFETMNDGFIKVFKYIPRFVYPVNTDLVANFFNAWLKKIMINAAIDRLRSRKEYFSWVEITENTDSGFVTDIGDQFSYKELVNVVKNLPPTYRAVFNLHVIDGYSHEEISNVLGISASTSRSNLAKAKEHLRKWLKETYEKVLAKYN